jgi:hypothetical protein
MLADGFDVSAAKVALDASNNAMKARLVTRSSP